MPLSNEELAGIAKEFASAQGEMNTAKAAIPEMEKQLKEKQEQYDRMYIMYRDAHQERATPYETEHRWLDGTTYATITDEQIKDSGNRVQGNLFFPAGTWSNSNAKLSTSGNGNPKNTSTNSEQEVLTSTVENNGLIALVNFLKNGQSGYNSKSLEDPLGLNTTSLTFTNSHGFSVGNYLFISGSGTSAMVKVTAASSLTISIVQIIPPANTISSGYITNNIPGFTNTQRQNLSAGTYQNILNGLTAKISAAAALYNTALNNQLTQLNLNVDAAAQISAAKSSVNAAKTTYDTWNALSATGVGGKWTDTALNDLAASYNLRNSSIAARVAQITAALGSVSQDAKGNYSGKGVYLQRFKCLNFLINSASGPLYQIMALGATKGDMQSKASNVVDKLATFSNIVKYAGFSKDPSGNTFETSGASQFAAGDSVLLVAENQSSIECAVTSVSDKTIFLDKAIPSAYNKDAKAGIIKRI